jgi:hypothetical protein
MTSEFPSFGRDDVASPGMKYHSGEISACVDHYHEVAIVQTYLPPDAISLRLQSN